MCRACKGLLLCKLGGKGNFMGILQNKYVQLNNNELDFEGQISVKVSVIIAFIYIYTSADVARRICLCF